MTQSPALIPCCCEGGEKRNVEKCVDKTVIKRHIRGREAKWPHKKIWCHWTLRTNNVVSTETTIRIVWEGSPHSTNKFVIAGSEFSTTPAHTLNSPCHIYCTHTHQPSIVCIHGGSTHNVTFGTFWTQHKTGVTWHMTLKVMPTTLHRNWHAQLDCIYLVCRMHCIHKNGQKWC